MKKFWFNLPVKNIEKSKTFFNAIGFTQNTQYQSEHSASFFIGEHKVVMMLFQQDQFKEMLGNEITDTTKSNEVLFNLDAMSKQEVDDFAITVEKAGGQVYSKPAEFQGFMYGFGFQDVDGHRWNMLYMDLEKMPM